MRRVISKTPLGSRWQATGSRRVFVVVEVKPFGKLTIQQEGRAYYGYPTQRQLLANFTRQPDKASDKDSAETICPLAESKTSRTLVSQP